MGFARKLPCVAPGFAVEGFGRYAAQLNLRHHAFGDVVDDRLLRIAWAPGNAGTQLSVQNAEDFIARAVGAKFVENAQRFDEFVFGGAIHRAVALLDKPGDAVADA